MKFFKYVVLPFFAAAVAVALAAAAVPGGSNLADIPGDTKMYTASDVAALFSALDPESAEDALSRIIAENEVLAGALRTNIVAIHEADVARDTNFASRPVVLSPAASDATISYGDLPSVYVGSATLPDARVVVVGDLESAANGDWENALGAAGDFARAIEYDGDFYDPFGCSFEEVRTYFSFLYDLLWGGSGVQPWDTASALRDFVEYAHANPSGGGGNFNVSNLVDRIDSLENTVSGLSPCSCEESQGCSCGDSIASAAASPPSSPPWTILRRDSPRWRKPSTDLRPRPSRSAATLRRARRGRRRSPTRSRTRRRTRTRRETTTCPPCRTPSPT